MAKNNIKDMTLRDYFAACALQGCYMTVRTSPGKDLAETLAEAAYAIADAMLEERDGE